VPALRVSWLREHGHGRRGAACLPSGRHSSPRCTCPHISFCCHTTCPLPAAWALAGERGSLIPLTSPTGNGQTRPDIFDPRRRRAANDLPRRRRQLSKFPADGRFPISWHHGHASASGMRDLLPSFRLGSEAGRGAIGWDKHDVEGRARRAPERFSTEARPWVWRQAPPCGAGPGVGSCPGTQSAVPETVRDRGLQGPWRRSSAEILLKLPQRYPALACGVCGALLGCALLFCDKVGWAVIEVLEVILEAICRREDGVRLFQRVPGAQE
jgi:hypothetical protein